MKGASLRQIFFTYLLGVGCFSAFLLPSAVSKYAGQAAILVPLFSALFSLGVAALLRLILLRYGSVAAFVKTLCGKTGEKIVRVLFALWGVFLCAFYAVAFFERLASTAFSYLSFGLGIVILYLAAGLFLFVSFRTVGRTVQIVFFLMLACFALLAAFAAGSIELKELLPVKPTSFTGTLRAFLFPMGLPGLLLFLFYDYEGEIGKKRAFYPPVIAGNCILFGVVFFTQCVFGLRFAEKLSYPFFALIKSTDSLMNAEHFESLLSGAWIVMSLCFFAVLLKLSAEGIAVTLCKKETGQPVVMLAVAGAALLLSLCIGDRRFAVEYALGTVMPLGNLLLGILLPCILSLTNKGRYYIISTIA